MLKLISEIGQKLQEAAATKWRKKRIIKHSMKKKIKLERESYPAIQQWGAY